MFKEKYKQLNNEIQPSEELISKTIENVQLIRSENATEKCKHRNKIAFKPIIIGGCILVCSVATLPVLAETIKNIYELMYLAPVEVAENFTPVEISTIDNNIKMEVVAININNDNNDVELYLTIEDLIGDKLNSSVQLGSRVMKCLGEATTYGYEFYGYEEELNKATFRIIIHDINNGNIEEMVDKNITFSLQDIQLTQGELNDTTFKIPIDLESELAPTLGTRDIYYTGGSNDIEQYKGATTEIVGISDEGDMIAKILPIQGLIPNIEPINVGINGVNITAVTYENNELIIQYGIDARKNEDVGSGYIFLSNINDNTERKSNSKHIMRDSDISCLYSFSGTEYENTQRNLIDEYVWYNEYVFQVPREELANYELYGYFRVEEETIQGDWSITFSLNDLIDN